MDGLKELLAQLRVFARFDVAVVDKLEEQDKRLYALEEDNKRLVATVRTLQKNYTELLYAFRSVSSDK